MIRKLLLATVAVGLMIGVIGCRHKCGFLRDDCRERPPAFVPDGRNPTLLPPAGLPTTPGPPPFPPPSVQPGPSGFPPPAITSPDQGPKVLFPDPLPGGASSRPSPATPGFLAPPVKAPTTEPPKASVAPGLAGYTKVKDGLYAGRKPALDGFDSLKRGGFRTVIFLHAAGTDVAAVKDMATTRNLTFVAIETTPETLADALKEFNRVTTDRSNHPVYVFGEDDMRAGAVWYLHFRIADSLGDDVARVRAKALGLSEQGDEGRAFSLAIQRVLETR